MNQSLPSRNKKKLGTIPNFTTNELLNKFKDLTIQFLERDESPPPKKGQFSSRDKDIDIIEEMKAKGIDVPTITSKDDEKIIYHYETFLLKETNIN